jgi:hypothetical protein
MNINRLETHDRLLHLKKDQEANIFKGADDCLTKNPLSLALQEKSDYIYIFAHPRTADDGVNKKMVWQPRLTKPTAQTNSYLFRAISKTDNIEIVWILPPRELWPEFKKGNVTENEIVNWSIDQFTLNRSFLERKYPDDLTDDQVRSIYRTVNKEMQMQKTVTKMPTPGSSEASRASSSLIFPDF